MFSKVWQIIMEHYTVHQHIKIICIYHQNSVSVRVTFRALREIYGQPRRPTEGTNRRTVEKFEKNGSVVGQPTPLRRRNARLDENIATARESVSEDPNLSIPHHVQEIGLSQASAWRILSKDLGFFLYKIQLTQELKPNNQL